jgi:hypothetical protein
VEIPGLQTRINAINVQSTTATTTRFRLQFPSTSTFIYGVQYRANLTDSPVYVNFATNPSAVIPVSPVTSQLTGNGSVRTIYVDATGTTGFFTVALMVTPYP